MKIKIKNIVKTSKIIYFLYYYIFSFLLRLLGTFIKTDKNIALFVCYGGRRYDDSTKVMYEYLITNDKYKQIKCIWAFVEPNKFKKLNLNSVKIDSLKYYIIAMKAGYWFTNSSIERGLNFKKKDTKYIIFQHGTVGIKKIGKHINLKNKSFKTKNKEKIDYFFIQGRKEKKILSDALEIDESKIFNTGLPRNDELVNINTNKVIECKYKLHIPKDRKVILYAPTFREFYKDNKFNSIMKCPFDFLKLQKALGNEYIFLVTAHYEIANLLNIPKNSEFVINAFDYPYINDLMIASDILISDYSSIIFDYSILEKPIFCYGFDYDIYIKNRSMYQDINNLFSHRVIKTQDDLIKKIKDLDYKQECQFTKKIKEEYIANCGGSVAKVAKTIFGN